MPPRARPASRPRRQHVHAPVEHGVDLYVRDLHYRAYRNMSAANRIHPGFPDVERVREDCDIKHKEQGYLHREEVQWGVMGAASCGIAVVWFGGGACWRRPGGASAGHQGGAGGARRPRQNALGPRLRLASLHGSARSWRISCSIST